MRHPSVARQTGLQRGRLVLGVIGLGIFLLTFTTTPFYDNSLLHIFHVKLFHRAW
jgi:hypothetical protein